MDGVVAALSSALAPVLTILPGHMQERISTSLAKGFEEYNARVAADTQPPTPGAYPDYLLRSTRMNWTRYIRCGIH